jgi:hypothetical protein
VKNQEPVKKTKTPECCDVVLDQEASEQSKNTPESSQTRQHTHNITRLHTSFLTSSSVRSLVLFHSSPARTCAVNKKKKKKKIIKRNETKNSKSQTKDAVISPSAKHLWTLRSNPDRSAIIRAARPQQKKVAK